MSKNLMTIGEIVEEYNVPCSTLNHYTLMGLLDVVSKKRNVRLYDKETVKERLKVILRLKNKGYPLYLIKKELLNMK